MQEEILVPIALFAIIPASIWAVSAYRSRAHKATMTFLETVANKGEVITPELVHSLGVRRRPKNADLRTGAVLLAIALSMLIFANVVPDDEGTRVMSGLAAFPGLIGMVFIGLWAFVTRKETD